jgi:hypothetical protein
MKEEKEIIEKMIEVNETKKDQTSLLNIKRLNRLLTFISRGK